MAINKVEEKGIALDDFIKEFSEAPFELFDGERVYWMPSLAGHTEVIRLILRLLEAFVLKSALGEVISEGTFILKANSDWVKGSRIPDIMFYAGNRLAEYKKANPDWKKMPYVLIPDLVIEVVSLNDSYSDINRKVDYYLQDGVKEIWVIDPQAENALIHTADKTSRLSKDDSIRTEILPDFALSLKELFV
jgi:Uma2 family endonuclease